VQGCKELLERSAQHRGSVPYLAAFRPRPPGAKDGPRVWNQQLVRFACYVRPDETLLGDPANMAFTDFCIRALGWKPPARRTAFDVLPLVLQAGPGEDPQMFELPPWYISRVSIKHSEAPWLWDMGIKWTGMPLESGMELKLGGLSYTAVPFSSWCAHLAPLLQGAVCMLPCSRPQPVATVLYSRCTPSQQRSASDLGKLQLAGCQPIRLLSRTPVYSHDE
jgi:nitric oxide synthase oxygenase domain/subunit